MKNVLPAVFIAFMTLAFTPAQASFMSAGKSIANNIAVSGSAITEVGYRGRSFRSRGFYKNRGFRSRGFYKNRSFRSQGFYKNRGFRSQGFYKNRGFRSRGFYKNRGFRFGRQHRSNRYAYGNSRKSQIANRIFTRQAQDGP